MKNDSNLFQKLIFFENCPLNNDNIEKLKLDATEREKISSDDEEEEKEYIKTYKKEPKRCNLFKKSNIIPDDSSDNNEEKNSFNYDNTSSSNNTNEKRKRRKIKSDSEDDSLYSTSMDEQETRRSFMNYFKDYLKQKSCEVGDIKKIVVVLAPLRSVAISYKAYTYLIKIYLFLLSKNLEQQDISCIFNGFNFKDGEISPIKKFSLIVEKNDDSKKLIYQFRKYLSSKIAMRLPENERLSKLLIQRHEESLCLSFKHSPNSLNPRSRINLLNIVKEVFF